MNALLVFGIIALIGAGISLLIRWVGGARGAVIVGVILTLLAAVFVVLLIRDAQDKQGFDGIASAIGMMMTVVITIGYWLGLGIAALRARNGQRRS